MPVSQAYPAVQVNLALPRPSLGIHLQCPPHTMAAAPAAAPANTPCRWCGQQLILVERTWPVALPKALSVQLMGAAVSCSVRSAVPDDRLSTIFDRVCCPGPPGAVEAMESGS
eukprot:scaffold5907_cov120-Isochrysis_galbana.AAC.3